MSLSLSTKDMTVLSCPLIPFSIKFLDNNSGIINNIILITTIIHILNLLFHYDFLDSLKATNNSGKTNDQLEVDLNSILYRNRYGNRHIHNISIIVIFRNRHFYRRCSMAHRNLNHTIDLIGCLRLRLVFYRLL